MTEPAFSDDKIEALAGRVIPRQTNWRRGFWRVLVVTSIIWCVVIGGFGLSDVLRSRLNTPVAAPGTLSTLPPGFKLDPAPPANQIEAVLRDIDEALHGPPRGEVAEAGWQTTDLVLVWAARALLPPLAAIVLFFGVGWAARGFAPKI